MNPPRFANIAISSTSAETGVTPVDISPADRLEITELYSRHFYSLDGLTAIVGGEADRNWADTFTPDGEFSIVRANGDIVAKVRRREELVKIYATFPDVQSNAALDEQPGDPTR